MQAQKLRLQGKKKNNAMDGYMGASSEDLLFLLHFSNREIAASRCNIYTSLATQLLVVAGQRI